MQKIIAVVGYANIKEFSFKEEISNLALSLGDTLMQEGYAICCGGLGGIMEQVCKGAKNSKFHTQNTILGILPNYSKQIGNKYLDLALPIGLDISRNTSLVSVSDAVVALGGGSGTLNEISAAWQLKKLIICLGDYGFSGELANRRLDNRRDDKIFKASNALEVAKLLKEKLPFYENSFEGIKP